jgi:TetR/AcrR family transcriptional regulator, cholesterol catabolism regulator
METKERIIQKADELFFRYGVRAVTMDDIAQELGISKKTIYQRFEDKDSVVFDVAIRSFENDKSEMFKIYKEAKNPIEEILISVEYLRRNFGNMNPMMLNDIRKYYPKVWSLYGEHKQFYLKEAIARNMKEGVEQELYRSDINIDILSKLRMEEVELAFEQDIYPFSKYNAIEIQEVFIDHFLRGIMTEKGLSIYNELKGS